MRNRRSVAFVVLFALSASLTAQEAYKPKFKGDPAHSNAEAAALGYMRTVNDAQRLYKKKHDKYATSLAGLLNTGSFTRRMIKTDRGDYTVDFKPGWSMQLIPKQFDAAHRAFFIDQTGTLRAEVDKPATAESPVLKAEP
jgi:hypothetical protein